ncbi:MAG TPA: BON domain-containing protein [Gemmatimonadaceae bacterium]|nr:BON domain-containing protein [Gemmatimonadaceae bacterium]
MARDFEDIHDIDDLNGDELRDVVLEMLGEHESLDIRDLTVRIDHGAVVLGGRVGTESERLIAEHVVTDQLGAVDCRNEIVVDSNYRATSPDAADEDPIAADREVGIARGDESGGGDSDRAEGDLNASLFGTTDVQSAIEDGTPWNPPDSPTAEGIDESGEIGESR